MSRKAIQTRRPAAVGWTSAGDFSSPGPASEELRATAHALIADSDRLATRIEQKIRELPVYRDVRDLALWGEIREVIRANVPIFLTLVAEGRKASAEEVGTAIHFARRRLQQGIPLRAHLRAHAVGVKIMWEELVESVINRPTLQGQLLRRALWAFQLHDAFRFTLAEAYREAQEGHTRHRDHLIRRLFDEIVGAAPETTATIDTCAQLVDLDLAAGFRMLVLRCPASRSNASFPAEVSSAAVVVAVAETAALPVEHVLSSHRKGELLLLLPGRTLSRVTLRSKLERALSPATAVRLSVLAGVSGVVGGGAGARQAYREAGRATELGRALDPEKVVHFYEDYVLYDVLESSGEEGKRLVAQTVDPILALGERGKRLVDTLDVYFRSGTNLKVTAATLKIHRNTLTYRLHQIQQLTGLSLGDSEHRLRMENALRLCSLLRRRSAILKETPRVQLLARARTRSPAVNGRQGARRRRARRERTVAG